MSAAITLVTSRAPAAASERFRGIVDAHYDVLWRFLRRMGVSEAGVEDAAQQVLLVLARRIDRVQVDAELSFLLGTAVRVAADVRKHRARSREVVDDERLAAETSGAPDADDELDRRRGYRLLDGLLAELPQELRAVLVMCELEELTMSEAARALRLPAGTVASRLRRAREVFAERAAAKRASLLKGGAP